MYSSFDPRRHGGACAVSSWSRGLSRHLWNYALRLWSEVTGHTRGARILYLAARASGALHSVQNQVGGRPVRVSGESSRSWTGARWTSSVVAGGPGEELHYRNQYYQTLRRSSEADRSRSAACSGEMVTMTFKVTFPDSTLLVARSVHGSRHSGAFPLPFRFDFRSTIYVHASHRLPRGTGVSTVICQLQLTTNVVLT